ncbi:hypothetical protein, partial [Actinosynnema sp. NPDC000082]
MIAQAEPGVAEPATWSPPQEANRTGTGGPPPGAAWQPLGERGQERRGEGEARTVIGCLADNDGVLPWFPMERHQISDRLELMVNLSNRNAVLAYRELTVKGTGLHLSVNWFLNTQEGYGSWERGYDRIGLRQYDT